MRTSKVMLLTITLLIAHSYLHAAAATDESILSQLSSESLTNEELVTILNSSDSNQISNALQQLSRMPERRFRILEMLNSMGKPLRECHRYELLATLRQEIDDSKKAHKEISNDLNEKLGLSPRTRQKLSEEALENIDSSEAFLEAVEEFMTEFEQLLDKRNQKMKEMLENGSEQESTQIAEKNMQMLQQSAWSCKVSAKNNAAIELLKKWDNAADELL